MIKKLVSFILCLSVFLSLSAFADQSGKGDVYYSVDFDDGVIPTGTGFTRGEDGILFVDDGKMRLKAADTYPPVSTVLFPYEVRLDEYMYECDITVLSSLSGNCWFSLCFGAVNDSILYQFTVKSDASAKDSVSLQYKNGASSWKTVCESPLTGFIGENGISADKFSGGKIKDGAEFRFAVAVKDGMAFGCIDGVPVAEGGLPAKRSGKVGINGRGVYLLADNVQISSDIPSWVSAADSFSTELYKPDTGITEPPTVIQRDRTSLPVYFQGAQRPAAVMMTVKESGGALHGYDGAVDLGRIEDRIKAFSGKAVPAFYVSDTVSASMLSAFIEENGLHDCFVIVSKVSLLEEFAENEYIRTIADMSSRDSVSAAEICSMLYSNCCRAVMLTESAADRDTVYELHKRLITVWVSGTAGVDSLFDSAVNGADVVITSESTELISVFEKIKETSVIRRQVIIYDGRNTPETLKGVRTALDAGISTVRLGVVYPENGEAVTVPSDYGVSDTSSYTALEEVFQTVYRDYPDSVLHLDINDKKTYLKSSELIREYEMTDRCVILSKDVSVLGSAAAEGIPAAYTGGPYTADGRDLSASLSSLCKTLNGLNSAYYAEAEQMPEALTSLMRSRGMFVCTDQGHGGVSAFTSGCGAYTVTDAAATEKLAASLEASADSSGRLSAKVKYSGKTELDVTVLCDILALSGDVKLSEGVITGDGTFTVICPQTAADGEKYLVFSNVIKISEEAGETETGAAEESGEDNRTLTIVIIAVSSVAAAAGVIVLLLLNRKKRKNVKKEAE